MSRSLGSFPANTATILKLEDMRMNLVFSERPIYMKKVLGRVSLGILGSFGCKSEP